MAVTSAGMLLFGILLSSALPAVLVLFVSEENHRLRTTLNLGGAFVKVALMALVIRGVMRGDELEAHLAFLPGTDLVLHADGLSVLFGALSTVLWLVTTVYAVGYLEDTPHRSRFFSFFNFCVSATMGVAFAGNLLTFLIFYEILTVTTYPLVVHRGTPAALRSGRIYLSYALPGGVAILIGVAWLAALGEGHAFQPGGFIGTGSAGRATLQIVFWLLVGGLGVKAALAGLHGWLPEAMAAPAPVSALLHAVAVVKAGAFGIVRIIYEVYGIELASTLGVLGPLAAWAAVTVVYGSWRALWQDDLKRRLAFSTVSQVSLIVLGAAIVGPVAAVGGLVHLVHQGLMKITLFFCAGIYANTLGIYRIAHLRGVGARMPLTTAAFTVAALAMMGMPPLAGFVSKWYLAAGSIEANASWVLVILAASTLLNAAYFLPIIASAWFGRSRDVVEPLRGPETHWFLLLPALLAAVLVILVSVFASAEFGPLTWTREVAAREFNF